MKGRYYDTSGINHGVSIASVMESLGLGCSTRKNIPCPAPDHPDKKPSARIYTDRNICRCFSCNRTFSVIDVVQISLGTDWKEACDYLIENFGCEGLYEDRDPSSKEEMFPLTKTDLEALGLNAPSRPVPVKVRYDERTDRAVPIETVSFSLRDFWKEDREGFNELIHDKAVEMQEHFRKLKDSSGRTLDILKKKLLDLLDGENLGDYINAYHKDPDSMRRGTKGFDVLYSYYTGRRIQNDCDRYEHNLDRLEKLEKEYAGKEKEYEPSL